VTVLFVTTTNLMVKRMKIVNKLSLLALGMGSIISCAHAAPVSGPVASVEVQASVSTATCDLRPSRYFYTVPPVSVTDAQSSTGVKNAYKQKIDINVNCSTVINATGYEGIAVNGTMDPSGNYFVEDPNSLLGIQLTNVTPTAPTPGNLPSGWVGRGEAITETNKIAAIKDFSAAAPGNIIDTNIVASFEATAAVINNTTISAGYVTDIPLDFVFNYS
jgi:hypothetical protein